MPHWDTLLQHVHYLTAQALNTPCLDQEWPAEGWLEQAMPSENLHTNIIAITHTLNACMYYLMYKKQAIGLRLQGGETPNRLGEILTQHYLLAFYFIIKMSPVDSLITCKRAATPIYCQHTNI